MTFLYISLWINVLSEIKRTLIYIEIRPSQFWINIVFCCWKGTIKIAFRLIFLPLALFSSVENKQNEPLSNYNRILIFPPQFPTLPRKISAYLQTNLPSDANTRIIRGFYKILNINDLCLRGILSFCKKHHFGLQNGPFRRLKSTISHPNIGFFACWNGLFRKAKWIFSDYGSGYIKRRFGAKWPLSYRF